ncbi:AAA family ATPase [Myxococcota bacterium]|nr:AAA family ATPase [Myxococcota bacterium]
MADQVGRGGFRPHELLGRAQAPGRDDGAEPVAQEIGKAKGDAKDAKDAAPRKVERRPVSEDAAAVVTDVLELTHRQAREAESIQYKKTNARTALARFEAVAKQDGKLSVGGDSFKLSAKQDAQLVLLEPNAKTITHVASGLASKQATLISAATGSGATSTVRWFLEVSGKKHELVRATRTTSLDALVGGMRPDETGQIRVQDGPLARCIRNGGVFVLDGLENADPQIVAALRALAKGAKFYHHPVSGQVIPVHEDFRLVLVGEKTKRFDRELVQASNHREIRSYDRDEHARLLAEQHGLPRELSTLLASFHESLQKSEAKGEIGFGRGFPLAWPLLSSVGARLAKKKEVSPNDVVDALWGIYGARLSTPDNLTAFEELVEKTKLGKPSEVKVKASKDPSFVHTDATDRALFFAERALAAGESVLLTAPGQAGATRLVSELAARRGQEVVTIVGHSGTDPQTLMETPVFTEKGELYFKPGRIADALVSGKLLYVDHVDFMGRERQNALFQLQDLKTIKVVEDGKLVEKPVHPNARVVLSATEGGGRGRYKPDPIDRASVTEVRLRGPSIDELVRYLPPEVAKNAPVAALVERVARGLFAEDPELGITKIQRFVDFARATELLSAHESPAAAALRAMKLLFEVDPKASETVRALEAEAKAAAPKKGAKEEVALYQKLLGLKPGEDLERLAKTGYRITESMAPHLDALAIAYRLGRPVLAVGPASSGKTVLGVIFAALVDKKNVRVNFSASTESRDLLGGLGPVNEQGKTVFRHIEGPEMRAAEAEAVLNADEWNLSREGQMAFKSWVDHRRRAIDPEADLERPIKTAFLYASQNPNDPKTGRTAPPPTITDCMFHIFVAAKPIEEKIAIVESQSKLGHAHVEKIAGFFADLEKVVAEKRLKSAVGPITCTERDMLKAARAAEHMIKRDGIEDPAEQRRIVGREVFRLIRDALLDPAEQKLVLDLLRKDKHFGKDVPELSRPKGIEKIVVKEGKRDVAMLQIGDARFPIRELGKNAVLDALVPNLDGVHAPVGTQLEFLESVLLGLELGQPLAVVGPTGTGKTMLMKYLAHELQLPWREQPFHADMTEDHLFGTTVVTKEGKVEFQYSPLSSAIKEGALFVGDEFLTLPNHTREKLNPLTEGTEIQISQKRPPETITKKDWAPGFRFVITTNGSDIRDDGFSDAEASRMRLIGLREISAKDDLVGIALRDYAAPALDYAAPTRNDANRAQIAAELAKLVDKKSPAGKLLKEAIAASIDGGEAPEVALDDHDVPSLELDDKKLRTFADALNVFTFEKKDAPLRAVLSTLLARTTGAGQLARLTELVPEASIGEAVRLRADHDGVVGKRLVRSSEVESAASFFHAVRELQRASGDDGLSPLTPRIFSSFMELFVQLRSRTSVIAAATRAAELALSAKVGKKLEKQVTKELLAHFGQGDVGDDRFAAPAPGDKGVWFGDTFIDYGSERPWKADNSRFPLTPARCKNLTLLADAVDMGKGRPISCTDDENGETVETLREFGRLTGRQVTVVSLPPNVDLESLIEKLSVSDDPKAQGGFEPVAQQIAQAVKDGHILVLRGTGNIPTSKLERLNSLGDGRQGIRLPRSGEWLEAAPSFRMVMLRAPGSVHEYSPALQNRLVEPLLTTRDREVAPELRAAELALAIQERTKISETAALRLGAFHMYLNQLIREGKFASGTAVGSLLNRDAEAIGHRLKWLQDRHVVEDELEMLHYLAMEVYGERFLPERDREYLREKADAWFGADGRKIELAGDVSPSPHLMRVGEWVVPRDPGGVRAGVPGPEAMLPPTKSLDRVFQKVVSAAQWNEPIHLAGDDFVADACVKTLARLTTSPLVEVEGNEELQDAYLFGGLVQNPKTGAFEEHEGLLWQAQREGGTLLIRNASKIPAEVLTRLVEIAATGHVSRVFEGKLEMKKAAFRLVLQTSTSDQPLMKELASLCTRVQCHEVTERADLRTLLVHLLQKVPGAQELAGALEKLSTSAASQLAKRAQVGRQPIRFDSTRLLHAAGEIARGYAAGKPLEDVVADVLVRAYLRPAEGLDLDEALAGLVEELNETLSGVLQVQDLAPIDVVDKPEVGALRTDYEQVAPALTSGLLSAAAAAITATIGKPRAMPELRAALEKLVGSSLVPPAVVARAEKTLAADLKGDELARELTNLARYVEKAAPAQEVSFQDTALDFLRGARMWDLDYRLAILERYDQVFAALAQAGSEDAKTRRGDVDRVLERFDAAGATEKLELARDAVGNALKRYKNRKGEGDEQLAQLQRDLLNRWDLVATSPIFKNHHLLRNELQALDKLIGQLEEAHRARPGGQEDVNRLVDALRDAGEILEGIRIAEQSAELRRGVERVAEDTEGLVKDLRGELGTIRHLEEAERKHRTLSGASNLAREILGSDLFLHMKLDEKVERPAMKSDVELRAEARRRAESELRPALEARRLDALARIQARAAQNLPQDPTHFFANYDLTGADVGLAVDFASRRPTQLEGLHDAEMANLDKAAAAELAQRSERLFVELKDKEEQQTAAQYKERLQARAQQVAARVHKSTQDLDGDLVRVANQLDLAKNAPELAEKLAAVRKDLEQASRSARTWAGQMMDFFVEAQRQMLRLFTFNFFGADKPMRDAPKDLDLDAVKKSAAALLGEIARWADGEDAKLPDYKKISSHQELTQTLTSQLMSADTVGDLAAKYAKLATIQESEDGGDLKRWLGVVLGRMAGDKKLREVLLRVDAFCTSAKKLTGEMDGGVAVEVAPVLEGVMRAAETIRSQPLAEGSYRSSIKALKVALQRIDELGLDAARLPVLINAVKAEMEALLADFKELGGENDKALELQTAAVQEMLRAMAGDDEKKAELGAELKGVLDELDLGLQDEGAQVEADRGFERVLDRSTTKTTAEQELIEIVRETKLKLVDVDLDRVRALRARDVVEDVAPKKKGDKADKADDAADDALVERRESVIDAARTVESTAADALGLLERDKGAIVKLLGELDDAAALGAMTHQAARLDGIIEQLGKVLDAEAQGFRGMNVAKPLAELRQIARALRASERVPVELANKLDATIEGARPLEAAFATDRFQRLAIGWATDALAAAREVVANLRETAAGMAGGEAEPAKAARVLEAMGPLVDRVAASHERLGAWSRFSLLSHVHQRVGALEGALGADAKDRAARLVESAKAGALALHAISLGRDAEQSLADAFGAYVDLAEKLLDRKKLEEDVAKSYGTLGELLGVILGAPRAGGAFDFDACGQAIQLVEKLARTGSQNVQRTARELSLSLGGLRSAALERGLDHIEAGFNEVSAAYVGRIKDTRRALGEASKRVLEYDAIHEDATPAELGRALKKALVDASQLTEGPAAALFASELFRIHEGLEEVAAKGGPLGAEARTIAEELDPMLRGAEVLRDIPDASGRFTTMVERFHERLAKAKKAGLKHEDLRVAEGAAKDLARLMKASREELAFVLDDVEAKHFPEEVAKRQPKVPEPEKPADEEPKIKSAVEELLAKGSGSGRGAGRPFIPGAQDGDAGALRPNVEGILELGRHGLGDGKTPPPEEGQYGPGNFEGKGTKKSGPILDAESKAVKVDREALPEGHITERSDKLRMVSLSDDALKDMKKRMNDELAKARKPDAIDAAAKKQELLTEFETFIDQHSELVDRLADTLRQHPGLETVVVVDQSGSTWIERRPLAAGETQILDQERATLAIVLAAHMRAERNCAVVGFGGENSGEGQPVSVTYENGRETRKVCTFVHKPMSERLDNQWADKAYGLARNWGGFTDLIEPMNVAAGQFTDKANNKLILVLTDAQLGNPADIRRYVENRRAEGIGVAMMGFGEATHIREVAGDVDDANNPGCGLHANNFAEAIQGGARLFAKTVVQNAGFRGNVKGAAQGIGLARGQEVLKAGVSKGPMESSLRIADAPAIGPDPGEVFAGRGPKRDQKNLVDRSKYEKALRELETWQQDVSKSAKYRACLQEIYELKMRHDREGIVESLREAVVMSLPKTRGQEWERKQLAGPLFDEEQLPMYVVGLAQGVPVLRIFKRKRASEETKATVVLAIDESSSMGDSDKMRANLEALIAYGDALKAADPDVKIAVVGFSDKVRLHAGFEQEWDDALKAHLLYQVQGTYDATDDERGGREAIGLLNMMDADVGQIVSFSDGQGMPGMMETMEQAAQEGYAFLTVGVTPDCKAVSRFDRHGLYVRNLAQLAQKLPAASVGVWEEAGRLIQ